MNNTDITPPRRRWPTILLVGSIALNLLLVGFVLGSEQRLRGDRGLAPPHSQIGRFLRGQDEARRAELAPYARSYWHESRQSLGQLRSARRALNAALTTQPLDETLVQQAMADVDRALLESSQTSQRALLPLLRVLSAAERGQFAAAAKRPRGQRPRLRHGLESDPGPGPGNGDRPPPPP